MVVQRAPVPIEAQQFSCPTPPEAILPDDQQLVNWSSADLFRWGSFNYLWAEECQQKLQAVYNYIRCYNGEQQYCISTREQ